jgi:hypothetical protein
MAHIPAWKGRNAKVIFYMGEDLIPVDCVSFSITANVTEGNDWIMGETRQRLSSVTNFYDIAIELLQQRVDVLNAILKNTQNDDDYLLPLNKQVGLSISPNDGTSYRYIISGDITIGAWSLSAGSGAERNTFTLPLQAQYFKQMAA